MFSEILLVVGLFSPATHHAVNLTADVICGEVGSDRKASLYVAGVISNRIKAMKRGSLHERAVAVLTKPLQFNGRCSKRGKKPSEHHIMLAEKVVGDLPLGLPEWFTPKIQFFTEAATAHKLVKRGLHLAHHYISDDQRTDIWFFVDPTTR
jgi:hypothetical protein